MRRGMDSKVRGTQIMTTSRDGRIKKMSVGSRSRNTVTLKTGDGSKQPAGARRNQVSGKHYEFKPTPYIVKSDDYYDYMSNGTKKTKDVSIEKFNFKSSKYTQLKKNIAANIKKIRSDKNLNCEDIAQKAGVTRQYVGQIEKEEKNITLEKLCAIARALDVDVEFLLSKTPNTQSEQYIRLLVGTIRKLSSHNQIELCIDIINKLNNLEENEK